MVAVGGGDKGVTPRMLPQISVEAPAAPQHLESVEAEAFALILHIQRPQPQVLRQPAQLSQGGWGIARKGPVKGQDLLRGGGGEQRRYRAAGGTLDQLNLSLKFHTISSLLQQRHL